MRSFNFKEYPVSILGAGELASGVALRLWRAGFPVVMTELEYPLAIRRTVSFSEAIYLGDTVVEEIRATRVSKIDEMQQKWNEGILPILVDPTAEIVAMVQPAIVVDARLAKTNLGASLHQAQFVIGLGPGFIVGQDVHAVIETNRGHFLGRVLWEGSAEADTRIPGEMKGMRSERVIYSPGEGNFTAVCKISDMVAPGEIIGFCGEIPVIAQIGGILRGLIHPGIYLSQGLKMADVDPRMKPDFCWYVSDKALAIGGGVLEAVLMFLKDDIKEKNL
jgi:xanthine dehydrogenase accessory factor